LAVEFELVRENERLAIDQYIWGNTIDLAGAFGWAPKIASPKRKSRSILSLSEIGDEISDEDARSLALAIARCLSMLAGNQRPSRKQMAHLLMFAGENIEGHTARIDDAELRRIAKFCLGGVFRTQRS